MNRGLGWPARPHLKSEGAAVPTSYAVNQRTARVVLCETREGGEVASLSRRSCADANSSSLLVLRLRFAGIASSWGRSFKSTDRIHVYLSIVSRFANVLVPYSINYFNRRVLEDIESWPVGVLAAYARLVELLMEFGPVLGMPHCRAMGSGLFELRPRGREGSGRAMYCFAEGRRVIVLHVFIKKTQAAPRSDIELARRRMKEVRSDH